MKQFWTLIIESIIQTINMKEILKGKGEGSAILDVLEIPVVLRN